MQEQRNTASQGSNRELSLEQRALLEARLLKKTGAVARSISPGNAREPRPLSFAQESLWFLDQYVPQSSLYNIPHVLRLKGALDVPALAQALNWVFKRHHSLRCRFICPDGNPVQIVQEDAILELSQSDLQHFSTSERKKEARRLINEESMRPFRLEEGPLIRAGLLQLDSDEHIFLITMHHIVSDLWSFQVFYRELTHAYEAFANGVNPTLPNPSLQFPEYAACQRRRVTGAIYEEQLSYWKEQLSGELPVLELPLDRPRPANLSFEGQRKQISMPPAILMGVTELSRKQNTTLFVTLMAAFQTLLHRYSGQTDIIVGSPLSNRLQVEEENMIGLLINTLPIRTRLEGNPTFVEVLDRVKRSVLGALTHLEAPVEKLIDDLKLPRNGGRNPLFQTVFQFVPDTAPALRLPRVTIEPQAIELGTAKFELTVTLAASANGLIGDIEYNTNLFEEQTIDRMVSHFQCLLESIISHPNQKIAHMNILPPAEREMVLNAWNQTGTSYPRGSTIHELFEEQAAKAPQAIALVFGNQRVSYSELNRRSNQLARYLQQSGVKPDCMVGFCVERSIEMVVGLLAILKAGGAYVTLDPNLPKERIAYMFEDTKSRFFLTSTKFRDIAPAGAHVVCVDEPELFLREDDGNLNTPSGPTHLAYVIYTSGSTGTPKGVLIPHRGVVRLVKETNYLQFSPEDVFLQFATISFDASTLELWGPLLNGGKLVIFPPRFDSLEQMGSCIRENGVTTLWLTAGLFHEMVENHIEQLKSVRYLLAGGDVLSPSHVVRALRELPSTTLINGYGPTENTTFTCCYEIPRDFDGSGPVPIGNPIGNTQVYVLDDNFQPVPVGVPGELFIGGDGLAREYLNAPDLTAQKFVSNPFSGDGSSEKLYRTGDRVRWRMDGTVEFIGRFDNQVKIRGYRIELPEVEAALSSNLAVQQCIVLAREDSSKTRQLVAYIIFKPGQQQSSAELREFLGRTLPAYMVPSAFVPMESFPLNSNGKVDRRQLPDPAHLTSVTAESAPPQDPAEARISEIWGEVLGIAPPGNDENFFEIGGHSLLATRVISRVNQSFSSELPLRALFEAPTVAGLARMVAENKAAGPGSHPLVRRSRRLRDQRQQSISQ